MDADLTQKEKIAAAKKKLRKFQQKTSRLDRKLSNGSSLHENDSESQQSDAIPAIHQQTIDILVEEKAELLKTRYKQMSINQQQQDEISVLKSQLYSTNAELTASEKQNVTLSNQLTDLSQKFATKLRDHETLSKQVENLNSQISILQTELSVLASERSELNQRLTSSSNMDCVPQNDMSDVPNPFKRNSDVIRLEEEVKELKLELEKSTHKLLHKEMQYDTLAGRATHQSTQLNTQVSALEKTVTEKDAEITQLLEKLETFTVQQTDTTDTTSEETTEVLPDTTTDPDTCPPFATENATQQELKLLSDAKVKLELALQNEIVNSFNLQKQLDQFKETHVDQNSLLSQINNDKATISRAMGQNKQLKEHMIELQDKLMRTSETNASLANEVQQLSARTQQLQTQLNDSVLMQESLKQDLANKESIVTDNLTDSSSHKLQAQIKQLNEKVAGLQQEKAIMGLSAAQVDSVKAMNVALQEKVSTLSVQLELLRGGAQGSPGAGGTQLEKQLQERIDLLEKQYNSVAVDAKIQSMLANERMEREKQRKFLDKYYEERLSEQVEVLEKRIAAQTKQFKTYVEEIQVTHDDEVEALRTQLSDLQQNFRTSLHTQYNQLVQYFTHKGSSDLKTREQELHAHYLAELSRLYGEMTQQLQLETQEIRQRKRTQSDELSIYTVDDPAVEEVHKDWEAEKQTLQSTIDKLEEELVKIEDSDVSSDEEEIHTLERSKEERKLHARINVLQMQLDRTRMQSEQNTQRYKQEIQRQSLVIQKLHMYLATQHYESSAQDNADDNISITSAGQFCHTVDMSSTKGEYVTKEETPVSDKGENATKEETPVLDGSDKEELPKREITLQNGLQESYTNCEKEFDTKLKYLLSKVPEGDQYVQHMQKLQDKFAKVMKDNANLHEKLKDFVHQNALLESETDTIGEYISLYQSQRKALRLQFQQKDNFINQLLSERSDMQGHITRLQHLITDLPCIEEPGECSRRERSNSVSSDVSTLSIMSTTRDEMLEIINKLKVKQKVDVIEGPLYAGGRGPICDI